MKLTPNTTSLIQSGDMGVSRALKAYFRYEIQARINDTIDGESDTNVNASIVAKKISVL